MAIPVIVHLFSFRKTQRVYFSTNRFLRQVQQATASRQKLRHLLVLAARLLFLFFLIMAFAQPYIPAPQQVTSTRTVSVYVDNSLSMSVPVSERERALDAAIQHAHRLAEVFPPDTRYRLLTNDFAPFSNAFKTRSDFQELLSGIRLSPISRSLNDIAVRLNNGSPSGDFYLLSDFQKSTLGDPANTAFADTSRQVYLIRFKLQNHGNVFADSAWLDNPFIIPGERNALHVRIRNTSQNPVEQLAVKLLNEGVQAGNTSVSVPALGVAEVRFNLPAAMTSFSRLEVRFNDYPAVFDNQLYVALNRLDRIRVVEIRDTGTPKFVQTVFGNTRLFVFHSFAASNLNYAAIQAADLVVLNQVNNPDAPLLENLRNYVRAGGTLLVIPGTTPQPAAISQLAAVPVTKTDEEKLEISDPDFNHPFFRNIVEDRIDRLAPFQARRVIDWGRDRAALLKFKNDNPLLSLLYQGNGRLYLLASPLHTEYTDLVTHFLFLPVMYRIAQSGKKTLLKPYYSLAESQVVLRTDSAMATGIVRLDGERALIPDQRTQGDRVVLELPRHTIEPGFYYAIREKDTLALLAFNADKRESYLEQHSEQSLAETLGNNPHVRFIYGGASGNFSSAFRDEYLGTPLWRYALLLALLFLLAEILLLRLWH
ncbi:MAG: membrane protein [Cyclobacteriaceae bacterium]|nr:MAG: membrane protein [Cyclobacteriaceae bacterium]